MITLCITLNTKKFWVLPTQRSYVFLRFSEQAAIISQYNVQFSSFITQKECVYCAVRTKSTNVKG